MKKDLSTKLFKTLLALCLAFGMAVLMPLTGTQAATKPARPVISVKSADDGTAIKVTISATERAEGYFIYIKSDTDTKYKKIKTLKNDGTAERSYTIKNLSAGTYSFKVKAYRKNKGKTVKSTYSKVKTVTLEIAVDEGRATLISELSNLKTGDTLTFGSYEQDNNLDNGKEPIEWIVLSNDNDELLVLSKYALDHKKYNETYDRMTWANCTLRKWLNDDFYNAAFSNTEKGLITTKTIINNGNTKYGTEGGKDTQDKVFPLSYEDIINTAYGFNSNRSEYDTARRCAATEYAHAQGVWQRGEYLTVEGKYTCWWWLRSPGADPDSALFVDDGGNIYVSGDFVNFSNVGVRPALYIDLNP